MGLTHQIRHHLFSFYSILQCGYIFLKRQAGYTSGQSEARLGKALGEKQKSVTVLVGATVNDKPNFITIAHIGIMPHTHRSLGIREHQTFSINIPPENLVKETDYVGLVTGKKVDKAQLFKVFYGVRKSAPMIDVCSVNMACRLERIINFPNHDAFVGEVVETHADESVLTGDNVDVSKIRPLLFDMPLKKLAPGQRRRRVLEDWKRTKKIR